jgi:hypothetical protein
MNTSFHWHCEETSNPFLHAFRAKAAARYERIQAERRQAEYEEALRCRVEQSLRDLAAAVGMLDPYTAGHESRVADLAGAIGRALRLDADRVRGIELAASIHDVGKISVPADILSKPGRLSEAEMNVVRSHAQVGYEIVKNVQFAWPIAEMVWQHHERLDGSAIRAASRAPRSCSRRESSRSPTWSTPWPARAPTAPRWESMRRSRKSSRVATRATTPESSTPAFTCSGSAAIASRVTNPRPFPWRSPHERHDNRWPPRAPRQPGPASRPYRAASQPRPDAEPAARDPGGTRPDPPVP